MEFLTVFSEGLLSFISPCVLPLIPLYISYLAGDNKQVDDNGNATYKGIKVFVMTLFFTLGIFTTFILLSVAVNYVSPYLQQYSEIISIIGGTIVIIFGLHRAGLIHIDILEKQAKLKANNLVENMNYLKAFLLGFVFSLGWSPCIGPMLANAIFVATTSNNYLHIIIYGLGFIIPFIITGLFTSAILNFLNKYKNILKYSMIIAGIIMIGFGGYMIYDASKTVVQIKNLGNNNNIVNNDNNDNNENNNDVIVEDEAADEQELSAEEIIEILLSTSFKTVNGNNIKLSDFKGKYVFLNFTTTWCPHCKTEMPAFEEFAKKEEVECFYVMSPVHENEQNDIDEFVKENDISLDIIYDEEGMLFYYCSITGYPTTYVINDKSEFVAYYPGAMDYAKFEDLFEFAKEKS